MATPDKKTITGTGHSDKPTWYEIVFSQHFVTFSASCLIIVFVVIYCILAYNEPTIRTEAARSMEKGIYLLIGVLSGSLVARKR